MRTTAFWLLAACASPIDAPAPPSPPPAALSLRAPYLVRGIEIAVTVSGAAPGGTVGLAGSARLQGPPLCPQPLAPACLGLSAPVRLLGLVQADLQGDLTFPLMVPLALGGPAVQLQAVSPQAMSAPLTVPVLDAGGDDDGDGFSNGAEHEDGLDPLTPDCMGLTDRRDDDLDGHIACFDCDDARAEVHAGAAEVCDLRDNDCDGAVDPSGEEACPPAANVVVVVIDDFGAYELGVYDPGSNFQTPVLDALANEGMTFDRVWSMPLCGPSRGVALTGRYPLRTGFGDNVRIDEADVSFPSHEQMWSEQLRDTSPWSYGLAAVGKWHLSTWPDGGGAKVLEQGFDTYLGALGNLYDSQSEDGLPSDYFSWEKYQGAVVSRVTGYLTADEVDDAIELASTLPRPWVIWLALHAVHEPFHEPPAEVLPGGPTPAGGSANRERYAHMVESVDAEIGRLLAAIPADTHVFVLGDNGSPKRAAPSPPGRDRVKDTVYEGGVRVPLIVRSPRVQVPGSRSRALVSLADLAPTLVELGGGDLDGLDLDGVSLLPLLADPGLAGGHPVLYTEHFAPNGFGPYTLHDRAVRDDTHKLIRRLDGSEELYALGDRLLEGPDLLPGPLSAEDQAAYDALARRLDEGDVR